MEGYINPACTLEKNAASSIPQTTSRSWGNWPCVLYQTFSGLLTWLPNERARLNAANNVECENTSAPAHRLMFIYGHLHQPWPETTANWRDILLLLCRLLF